MMAWNERIGDRSSEEARRRKKSREEFWARAYGEGSGPMKGVNDDRSPLLDLMTCVVCKAAMKLERMSPDRDNHDLVQYRCERCGEIEQVRLIRRSR